MSWFENVDVTHQMIYGSRYFVTTSKVADENPEADRERREGISVGQQRHPRHLSRIDRHAPSLYEPPMNSGDSS